MVDVEFEKPPGFDKWLSDILADGVSRCLVEAAIQKIHSEEGE